MESGYSINTKSALVRMYSMRALQASTQIFLKVDIRPDTTRCRLSGPTSSITLNEIGWSRSNGAKYTTSCTRCSGTYSRSISAAEPCGSINATPSPFWISWAAMFSKSVDFPIPVLPTTYMCRWRSLALIPKVTAWPRASVCAKNVIFSGSKVVMFVQYTPTPTFSQLHV